LNYLAHAYFSFNHPEILAGNMISDFVKGKKKYDYPPGIQKGIALHRDIDAFTDAHEATKMAKEIFRPHYRLYAGAFIDVVYDYFLANDKTVFTHSSLLGFSQITYSLLGENSKWFPEKFAIMFPYMKSQNWLYNYQSHLGVEKSFGGLVRRASYITESETAFRLFTENTEWLQQQYNYFSGDIKQFAENRFKYLLNES
jgi:acyl carrier protein phosphodiesterase